MDSALRWALFLAALICNCGFWLALFNIVNSTGLKRKHTKRIEKLVVVACFATPALALFIGYLSTEPTAWPIDGDIFPAATSLRVWLAACLLWAITGGVVWLESRRWIFPPENLKVTQATSYVVSEQTGVQSEATELTRFLGGLPGNQIGEIEINRKTLTLLRKCPEVDGLTIGHISDIHLTGQLCLEHYQFVFDTFQDLEPDIIMVSGDIIDYAKCLPWIEDLFSRLSAPLGKVFVLGNHDRRIADVSEVSSCLEEQGMADAGKADICLPIGDDFKIEVLGNELPWLRRHLETEPREPQVESQDSLRVALSHTPDQLSWARREGCDLMLAGHTHGGQARLPIVGPLVSPSRFGTRFASGVFVRPPTLLHVSRGVAGTHPLRFRCRPEASLLTLRSPDA